MKITLVVLGRKEILFRQTQAWLYNILLSSRMDITEAFTIAPLIMKTLTLYYNFIHTYTSGSWGICSQSL